MEQVESRDELFMQLLKQTRSSGGVATLRAWELLLVVSCSMPPSKEHKVFVSEYVNAVCRLDVVRPHIRKVARKVQAALAGTLTNGMRKRPPSMEELEAQVLGTKLTTPVYLIDRTRIELPYEIGTTVASCIPHLGHLISLNHYGTFGLFTAQESETLEVDDHMLVENDAYIADVLADLRDARSHGADKFLLFKKQIFSADDAEVREPRFHELCYLQVQQDYLRGLYPVDAEEAVWLTAVQVQACESFSNRLITSSTAVESTVQDYSPARLLIEEDQWTDRVLSCCNRMAGVSKHQAWRQFLGIIGRKIYGKALFFQVTTGTDPLKLLTPTAMLAVNRKGIHLFRDEPYSLAVSASLQEIMHYGSSKKSVFFKVKRAEQLLIFRFGTPHGEVICSTLQQHINHAFMRRFKARAAFMTKTLQGEPSLIDDLSTEVSLPSEPLATRGSSRRTRDALAFDLSVTSESFLSSRLAVFETAQGLDDSLLRSGGGAPNSLSVVLSGRQSERSFKTLENTLGLNTAAHMATDQSFHSLDLEHATTNHAAAAALIGAKAEASGFDTEIEIALLKDALSAASTDRDLALARESKLKADLLSRGQACVERSKDAAVEKLERALSEISELKQANERKEEDLRQAIKNKGVTFELFEAVQGQLDNALEKNSDHQVALSHFQEKLQEAHAREKAAKAEISSLKSKLAEGSEARSESAELEIGRWKDECEHLKAQLRQAEGSTESLYELNAAHQEEKSELQASIADLQAQLLLAQQEQRTAESQAATKQKSDGAASAEQKLAVLEAQCTNLAAGLKVAEAEKRAVAEQAEDAEYDRSKMQQQLKLAREMYDNLKTEMTQLETTADSYMQQHKDEEVDRASRQSQVALLAEECENLKAQLQANTSGQRSAEQVEETESRYLTEIQTLTQALAVAKLESAGLPKEHQSSTELQNQVAELKLQLQGAKEGGETVEVLQEALDAAESTLEEKQRHIHTLTEEFDAVLKELKDSRAALTETSEAGEKLAAANAAIEEKTAECRDIRKRLKEVEAEVEDLKEVVGSRNSEQDVRADRLRMEVQKLKQELRIAQDIADSYGPQQIANLSKECAQLKQDLKSARKDTDNSRADLLKSNEELKEGLEAAIQERDKVEARLSQLQAAEEIQTGSGTIKALSPVESALVFELWRTVEENSMLREQTEAYEKDVDRLISTGQLGHQNSKQKLQYHLSWKKDLEGVRQECTLLLRERFQLEQCIRYLSVRCGLAVATTDVTATQWRDAIAKLQPASLAISSARHYSGQHGTRMPDLKLQPPARSQEGAGALGVESTVEQHILQRVAHVCSPQASKNEGEWRTSGPDSRIVTTVRPKAKESEVEKDGVEEKSKGIARSVTKIPSLRTRQP